MGNMRFRNNDSGAIRDIKTNLVWLKDAGILGMKSWEDAVEIVSKIQAGKYGLADSSVEGDWRLPSMNELSSLFDYTQYNPALPEGHPFINVQSGWYWSGTTYAPTASSAWIVNMVSGDVNVDNKSFSRHVWAVRSGQRPM